jgi:homoserine O-succinyltransferase/O-acetyltransferase
MPVYLESNHSGHGQQTATNWLFDKLPVEFQQRPSRCIRIGLVNNMSDGALTVTEQQFLSLLDSASDDVLIHLSLYALPGIPRKEQARCHIESLYSSVENLWDRRLDGLIVTGREPLMPNLKDEPYWESFTRVLEWAQDNTYSTVWSCLAAHAAILHMDGICRVKSEEKHCGIFECERVSNHMLTLDTPSRIRLPHSRWNGISENALTSCGYDVLTRSIDAGVDTFIKQKDSLFLFFQGHPEYEASTLLLEYRRDVGRYLRRERDTYPSMPRSYFDEDTVNALTAIREKAMLRRSEELLAEVSVALEKRSIENTWHSTAACIYRNWLEYICGQKRLSHGVKDSEVSENIQVGAPTGV